MSDSGGAGGEGVVQWLIDLVMKPGTSLQLVRVEPVCVTIDSFIEASREQQCAFPECWFEQGLGCNACSGYPALLRERQNVLGRKFSSNILV